MEKSPVKLLVVAENIEAFGLEYSLQKEEITGFELEVVDPKTAIKWNQAELNARMQAVIGILYTGQFDYPLVETPENPMVENPYRNYANSPLETFLKSQPANAFSIGKTPAEFFIFLQSLPSS